MIIKCKLCECELYDPEEIWDYHGCVYCEGCAIAVQDDDDDENDNDE